MKIVENKNKTLTLRQKSSPMLDQTIVFVVAQWLEITLYHKNVFRWVLISGKKQKTKHFYANVGQTFVMIFFALQNEN